MLKLHNTLTRDKQEFTPIVPGEVRLYVCGMTVYDYCHLGHARVMVVFDMITRWLRTLGYRVTYVRNITDIDDKIIKRAAENGEAVEALTARFIAAMREDAAALGTLQPDFEPRATEYIAQMQDIIAILEKKGLAYGASDGDVNYSVREFPGYGKLSGKSLEDLRAGERVEIGAAKHDPLDFVLWKHAKPEEPQWPSPWGAGRPGWHIECSAMSSALLGRHFDIHGGGQDLQFPHHENEIAQSEGAFDADDHAPFVNYWLHNGFVRVVKNGNSEKMSKSLGNFFTVRDVLAHYDAEVVRFFILRAHYRSPLNYSDHHLDDARQALTRLYTALRAHDANDAHEIAASEIDWNEPHAARFRVAMDDDFNTPEAMAVLFDLANIANRDNSREAAATLKSLAALLGLLGRSADEFLQAPASAPMAGTLDASAEAALSPAQIDDLIAQRIAAKKAKNYAQADGIRKTLAEAGIVLEDSAQGTTWRRA